MPIWSEVEQTRIPQCDSTSLHAAPLVPIVTEPYTHGGRSCMHMQGRNWVHERWNPAQQAWKLEGMLDLVMDHLRKRRPVEQSSKSVVRFPLIYCMHLFFVVYRIWVSGRLIHQQLVWYQATTDLLKFNRSIVLIWINVLTCSCQAILEKRSRWN